MSYPGKLQCQNLWSLGNPLSKGRINGILEEVFCIFIYLASEEVGAVDGRYELESKRSDALEDYSHEFIGIFIGGIQV